MREATVTFTPTDKDIFLNVSSMSHLRLLCFTFLQQLLKKNKTNENGSKVSGRKEH